MALRCVVCLVVARTGPRSDGVVAPQRMRHGSGPNEPGNDALASVVTHIQYRDRADGSQLPADFPGHQGLQARPPPQA